jgi:hypothetical protein
MSDQEPTGHGEQGDQPDHAEQTDQPEQGDQPDHAEQTDQPEQGEQPEQGDQPDQSEQTDQLEQGDQTEAAPTAALPDPVAPAAVAAAAIASVPPVAPEPAGGQAGWPSKAKLTAAMLPIVALLGVLGTAIGFSRNSDDEIAALEAQRDAASAQVATVEAERDEVIAQLATVEAERDQLADDLAQQAADSAAELADAVAKNEQLASELATETERADAAEATLAGIIDSFPVTLDTSLVPEDLPGTYSVGFVEAYCEGLTTCGTVPSGIQATISTTPEGFLRIAVPGVVDTALFALDGSLYAITGSTTALPQCNGVDRLATVTLTMYADDVTISQDLTRRVDSIGASITIDAPDDGPDCPPGLVFYASSFTAVG